MAPRSGSSLLTVDDAHWTPLRFLKVTTGSESSGDEFGVLEDDRCIDTRVFQQRQFVHELVFACSPPPSPRSQISHALLTRAEWCAIHTVARCELGLLPVIKTTEGRSPSVLALIGARWTVFRLPPSVPSSRFTQTRHSAASCFLKPNMAKKKVLDGRCNVSPELKSHSPVRQRTGSRISRSTDPPRRGTQRRRQTTAPWSRSSGRADSPCSQRTESIYDSEPDLWKLYLDEDGSYCL